MRTWVKQLFLTVAAWIVFGSGAGAADTRLELAGAPEVVFDWRTARCETWDIPDTPVRAWRNEAGIVHLLAGSERSRLSRGPRLARLERDCTIVHEGSHDDDPAAYDDRAWIAAPYREGDRLVALAHVEFHGHERRDLCPAGDYMACWWNVIVERVSQDGGATFRKPPGGIDLVAALPYRPGFDTGRREGYFSPSNIFRRGDHLYAFVFAEAHGDQDRGACLIRRIVGGRPDDWRAWDGTGFSRRFVDPFRDVVSNPGAHVCVPVPGIVSTLSSVVRVRESTDYIAVTPATLRDEAGARRSGIWWTRSADLVHWDRPRLLLEVPLLWRRDCEAPAAYAYPSFIDDDSVSDNFEDVDTAFWLYLVEMPLGGNCRVGPERNLIRYPVSLLPAPDGS